MCQPHNLSDAENGRRDSGIQPEIPSRKKALYMDEAISKTKFGLFNYVIIGLCGVTLHNVSTEACAIAYVLPVSECDLNLTSSEKGILAGIVFFGIICGSHLWGFLGDTKGRRRITLPTLIIASLMSVICSFVQNFYIFTTLRFLNGFFVSASAANMMTFLGEFHNNNQRSRAIMGAAVVFSILMTFMPINAWLVINQDWSFQIPFIDLTYKPWRLFLVVCSLPGLLSAVVLLFLPESPKFVLGQGNKEATYRILQKMNRWNNGKESQLEDFDIYEETESIENRQRILAHKNSRFPLLKSVLNQTAPLFKPPYLKSTFLICTIQFGICSICTGMFVFVAEILNKMSTNVDSFIDDRIMMCDAINMKPFNISVQEATYEYIELSEKVCVNQLESSTLANGIIIEVVFGLGSAVAGLLINKLGKFPMIFLLLFTTGLSGIGCMFTDIPLLQIILFIWLLSCAIAVNILNAVTVDVYPTILRAMAMSISIMFARFGGVAGSNIIAHLLNDHCEATFHLAGSIIIAMGVLTFFIPNIHKKDVNS